MQLVTRKFNVDEYHKMAETGILTPEDRVELIKGKIIAVSPIEKRHAATINRLNHFFYKKLGEQIIISVQNSIRLDNYSEPHPDLVLLKYRSDFYENKIPEPTDVDLLIEMSDSTLKYDQEAKIPLYAKSNISEVWIVNLNNKILEVYRQPKAEKYLE